VALEWLKRLFGSDDEPTAARQQGDPTVLDRSDDPRGGTQSDEYRHADPRDVVEAGGTTMSGRAGHRRKASLRRSVARWIAKLIDKSTKVGRTVKADFACKKPQESA
jgi:hypothetical protein